MTDGIFGQVKTGASQWLTKNNCLTLHRLLIDNFFHNRTKNETDTQFKVRTELI